MAGRAKRPIKDTKTGEVYESMYAAGKAIGPKEYATLKQDQHIWFAIHRDKANVGRFQTTTDGTTWEVLAFTPSKRKSAAERKASDAAKSNGATSGAAVPAGETKEARIARLRAELEASEAEPTGEVAEEAEEAVLPPKGKLAGSMKVAKTA